MLLSPALRPLVLVAAALSATLSGQQPDGTPLRPCEGNGALMRWRNKPVHQSRLLDDMESLSTWSFTGRGEMALSAAPKWSGDRSLRLSSATGEATTGGEGEWADLVATRRFAGENWSAFNRLSLWVYPDIEGAPAISCSLMLHNDGAHKLPDRYNEGRNESIPLVNHEWNHVIWEIAPLDRDRITALDFAYSLPKKLPDPGDRTVLYLDQLELQLVDADYTEGWEVAPGRIAFSGSGYSIGASKSALASDLPAGDFSVLRQDTGEPVLTKPASAIATPLGSFQLLDFSEIRAPGAYLLKTKNGLTKPFQIGDNPWRDSIWKAINFLYSERCGAVIPGVHGICHQDCYTSHGDRRIVVNGGYHDAGDLSATGHTPGMVYAMLSLAQRLHDQGLEPALEERLAEEAKWGLNWVLKTRFGDGYRSTGQLISYWTNGIMGDADDRHGEAVNDLEWNFRVAGVEALASRVFNQSDPELAHRSLAIAKEDWQFAVQGLETAAPLRPAYGQPDELERNSLGALASVDLYEATGDRRYAEEAFRLARVILASQERKLQPWTIPLAGFFYTSPRRDALFQRFHVGEEQAPIVALARLCEAFPDHTDWMQWYSALVLHSQYYLKRAAQVNQPYGVLPAAIYRERDGQMAAGKQDWTPLRAADADAYLAEVRQGVPLGGDYYLRRFPVWFDFRGNFSVLLSQAKALSTAARVRGDLAGVDLAEKQAQWVVGRNPFAASIMYGEGYDWTPLYAVRSGQMTGALPVGIETKGFRDVPYWPHQICWTYKEVWTHPVGRWIWLMQDLAGPAVLTGLTSPEAREAIQFRETTTGVETQAMPVHGTFRVSLAAGRYAVQQGGAQTHLTVLPGGLYALDLRPERSLSFEATAAAPTPDGALTLRVDAHGSGKHTFTLRTDNLHIPSATATVDLEAGMAKQIVWRAHIEDQGAPWIAVVIADSQLSTKQELTSVYPH